MGIRTLCFVLAGIFAMATDWTVAVWICVVAAAILPYPAVVFANNIDRRQSPMTTVSPTRAIEASSARAILGSVVSDDEKPDDNEPDDNEPDDEQSDDDSAPSAPRTDRPS